ncbi:hypothetical protein C0993_005991, partial [Termitomyces sp. T159_Od127]
FVDRDMVMMFHGGGVGHKNVHEATDVFLQDRHLSNVLQDNNNDIEELEEGRNDSEEADHISVEQVKEKEDYGYENSMEQENLNEASGIDNDEWDNEQELDILSPEDGDEYIESLDDLLGYTDD